MSDRMLFGEFLVKKGILDAPTVLGLLVEQIKGQPSIAEIIYSNRLLTEEQQLGVLRTQSQTGWDYQQACVHLKIWNDTLAREIMDKSSQGRMPIGQMIVTKGLVGFADLTKVLDEFVGLCSQENDFVSRGTLKSELTASSAVPVTNRDQIVTNTDVGLTPAHSEGRELNDFFEKADRAPKFATIDPVLLAEFFELIPEARRQEIAAITRSWAQKVAKESSDVARREFRALVVEMGSIRVAARFVNAELIEKIMSYGEILAANVARNDKVFTEYVAEIAGACDVIYELAWALRGDLATDRSERAMWESPDRKAAYMAAIASVEAFCARSAV